MLHEYLVSQQLKLQQKRIEWVNRNAWMFIKQPKKNEALENAPVRSKKQSTCCV